jgi:hypothetical protein
MPWSMEDHSAGVSGESTSFCKSFESMICCRSSGVMLTAVASMQSRAAKMERIMMVWNGRSSEKGKSSTVHESHQDVGCLQSSWRQLWTKVEAP